MYSKIKRAALILCAAAMLTFSLVGCTGSESSADSSSAAASSQSSSAASSSQTSETSQDSDNYSQEISIDEDDENATMPQASDSVDLG